MPNGIQTQNAQRQPPMLTAMPAAMKATTAPTRLPSW